MDERLFFVPVHFPYWYIFHYLIIGFQSLLVKQFSAHIEHMGV